MTRVRDVVVIGGSAGGVAVVRTILGNVARALPARVFLTLHRAPTPPTYLVEVLGRGSALPVSEPANGERARAAHVYLAPRDHHMRLDDGRVRIDRGPREHHARPAIDPLFASAAQAYGPRVVGVLLSGCLSDGVAGLITIKERGGVTLVQDPAEALFPSMPENALIHDHVDLVFRAAALPGILLELASGAPLERAAEASQPAGRASSNARASRPAPRARR